jgi:hypothetical protein
MMTNIFSHDVGHKDYTEKVTKQDFYGNDGVCLFKYFVHKDDPQKEFVWAILAVNFACFIFISISYILISLASKDSSKDVASAQNKIRIDERNRKMNRRITIIIATDFCCWVPFIVICSLHSLQVLDATPWYSIFSMTVLPINSVINPLLYDDAVTGVLRATFQSISTKFINSTIYQSWENYIANVGAAERQGIEIADINLMREGKRSVPVCHQAIDKGAEYSERQSGNERCRGQKIESQIS